jgi:hypothetical protein
LSSGASARLSRFPVETLMSFRQVRPVNDHAWKGAGEKYIPQYPSKDRDGSGTAQGLRVRTVIKVEQIAVRQ